MNGIQEVSGSIPLISTTSFLLKKQGSKENFELRSKYSREYFDLTLKKIRKDLHLEN